MVIDVDYEVGVGGSVSVTKNDEFYDFEVREFDENDYADIGIEVEGHGNSWITNDVYNRYALPSTGDVSPDEYSKIFNDIKSEVVEWIRNEIESFFEHN